MPNVNANAEKLKVFISYLRKDSATFADELVVGLEDHGFAPFLDRHDIVPGESWEAHLGGLIGQADTLVLAISPEAVKWECCGWEVNKALALSKRILPVVYKPVPDSGIPEKLRVLQFVRFDTSTEVMRPLRELVEALRQDIDWIREHTRLGELAAPWQARGHPESLLPLQLVWPRPCGKTTLIQRSPRGAERRVFRRMVQTSTRDGRWRGSRFQDRAASRVQLLRRRAPVS